MTTTLFSTYQSQIVKNYKDMLQEYKKNQPIMIKVFNYIIFSMLCTFFLLIVLVTIQFIKHKLQKEMEKLHSTLEDIVLCW